MVHWKNGKEQESGKQGKYQSECSEASDSAIPQDGENLLSIAAAAKSITGICQSILVKRTGGEHKKGENQERHQRSGEV
jgi:hypothetical protein